MPAKKTSEPKLTKKMLTCLDRSEVRRVAINMGMPTTLSYKVEDKDLHKWVLENPDDFILLDIGRLRTPLGPGKSTGFRDGVLDYVEDLQSYLSGEGPAPDWPPVGANIDEQPAEEQLELEEDEMSEPTEEAEEVTAPPMRLVKVAKNSEEGAPKKKRSYKKRASKKKKDEPEEPVEETSEPKKATLPKKAKKEGGGAAARLQAVEAAIANLGDVIKQEVSGQNIAQAEFTELLFELQEKVDRLQDASALRDNAVLFLINMSVEEGEEFASLEEVPVPDDYL